MPGQDPVLAGSVTSTVVDRAARMQSDSITLNTKITHLWDIPTSEGCYSGYVSQRRSPDSEGD